MKTTSRNQLAVILAFADGAEAGVAVGLWPPHASSAAADAKITAHWFLEVIFIAHSLLFSIRQRVLRLESKG